MTTTAFTTSNWVQGKRPMGVGIMVPIAEDGHFGPTPRFDDIVEICKAAADSGLDSL